MEDEKKPEEVTVEIKPRDCALTVDFKLIYKNDEEEQ